MHEAGLALVLQVLAGVMLAGAVLAQQVGVQLYPIPLTVYTVPGRTPQVAVPMYCKPLSYSHTPCKRYSF